MKARLMKLEDLQKKYPNWDNVIASNMFQYFDGVTEHEFREINHKSKDFTHRGPEEYFYHSDWFMSIAEEIFAEIEEKFLTEEDF